MKLSRFYATAAHIKQSELSAYFEKHSVNCDGLHVWTMNYAKHVFGDDAVSKTIRVSRVALKYGEIYCLFPNGAKQPPVFTFQGFVNAWDNNQHAFLERLEGVRA